MGLVSWDRKGPLRERAAEIVGGGSGARGSGADYQHFALFLPQMPSPHLPLLQVVHQIYWLGWGGGCVWRALVIVDRGSGSSKALSIDILSIEGRSWVPSSSQQDFGPQTQCNDLCLQRQRSMMTPAKLLQCVDGWWW